MNFREQILLFISIYFIAATSSLAQLAHTKSFDVKDGLSQSNVTCLLHDSRGFLWIGTQDGLNRYDGYEFTTIKQTPSLQNTLSNNTINHLMESESGDIWIATNNGLNKYNPHTGKFTSYLHKEDDEYSLPQNRVFHVYQDSEGNIWVKTLHYLSKFKPESGKFYNYEHFNDYFNYFDGINNFPILEDEQGRLWVGTKDGLTLFDKDLEIFKRYYHRPESSTSLSDNRITHLYQDKKGNIWVATNKGLNLFDPDNESFKRYLLDEDIEDESLPANIINVVYEDKEGVLWVGTEEGLFVFNWQKEKFEPAREVLDSDNRLLDGSVRTIAQGRSKVIWTGGLQGLLKIQKKLKNFEVYKNDRSGDPLFGDNIIASIYKENNSKIWIGTWTSGLFWFNPNSMETRHFTEQDQFIPDDDIHILFRDSKKRLWIGTQNGIVYYDLKSQKFVQINEPKIKQVFENNRIYSIKESNDNKIWFASRNGLHILDDKTMELNSYFNKSYDDNSLSSNQVYDILIDSDDDIWIATDKGLNRYNKEEDDFKRYDRIDITCDSCLLNNEIISLYEDSLNNIWIGTTGGLHKFDKQTENFLAYTEEDGLPNNFIYAILEDDRGNLWISTNLGISKFNPYNEEFSNYTIYDGLQHYEYNHLAAHKAYDGEFFFGGIEGLNAFYPDSIQVSEYMPKMVITSVEINTDKDINSYKLFGKDTVFIPYNHNLLILEFSSLDMAIPSENQYAYMLEGLEDNWIHIQNRRYTTFSRLSPGKYKFRVKGTNNDGVWNEHGASLHIIVETPFWRTELALVIYLVLGITLIFLIFHWRTKRLRKANRELKEKEVIARQVAKQKEELSIKNRNITDSLIYAKRIQESLLPTVTSFKNIFENSFILYKPKDIVSGDFYWINRVEDKLFIAVVDCTGHGVPGAFMSIIGVELLNNITSEQKVLEPDKILYDLNKGISMTLSNTDGDSHTYIHDGMDIALCVLDEKNKQLEFAGAFRPLYLLRDNKIEEIKGDRFSVGMLEYLMDEPKIHKKTINLKDDDIIYLFTDGYADQFGGPDSKKFKYRRFRHLLLTIHQFPMNQQKEYLDKSLQEWQGSQEQVDDILIVGFRFNNNY
ncbi:MAG: two-component regulator propeller domain-containing protein [Bacteroidales bacterium]